MAVEKTSASKALAEVAALLGGSQSAEPGAPGLAKQPSLDALKRLTHRQLLESSRRIGLAGVSRLNKDALAERLFDVFVEAGALRQPGTASSSAAAPAEPKAPGAAPVPAGPIGDTVADQEPGQDVLTHKFEVGERSDVPVEELREIPWGYGRDRVTAMAVDPERLFVYWEVLDDSIARARAQLGPSGAAAWLNVRVYDTTGRLFDGTNAHSYFDHRVERGDRQWFFQIGKPTSEAFVEIGLRSSEGYFVKIARSGRVEFPRREPTDWSEPEWLTVRMATGHVERAGLRTPARSSGAAAAGQAPRFDPAPTWALRRIPWEDVVRFGAGEQTAHGERVEWEELLSDGGFEGHRTFSWEGPATITSWEAGPFTYPVEVPEPVREAFVGKTRVYRVGGRTHIVYGPWQVVIRGLGAHQGRAVLSRWEVYRSWVSSAGSEVREAGAGVTMVPRGASERVAVGASERRWLGGSELWLGGASEVFFLGASEVRLGGSSETLFAGASQWMLRGSSERQLLGQSELRMRGASDQRLGGASELAYGGASDRRLGGGGSEGRLGGDANVAHDPDSEGTPSSSSSPYPSAPGALAPDKTENV